MLTAKVYEAVKTDVAYVIDKTVTQIKATERIMEYLGKKEFVTSTIVQQLCGFNKDQAYRLLNKMCNDKKLCRIGNGRGSKYKLVGS